MFRVSRPPVQSPEIPSSGYSSRMISFLRERGHADLADEIEGKKGQPQAAPASQELPRYADPAEPILRAHGIDAETAANLWDAYHQARNSKELMHALINVDVSNELKNELYTAKRNHDPVPTWLDRVERVVDAIKSMTRLNVSDPARGGDSPLRAAESHPHVFQALVDAQKNEGE
jgi:hypothetical protein